MREFTANELNLIKKSIFMELTRLYDKEDADTATVESLENLYEDFLAEYKAKKQEQK